MQRTLVILTQAWQHMTSELGSCTRAPQGCVLSPLLYSLFPHDCVATHSSNTIVKFADDTTIIGQITDGDETAYREEVENLTSWCQDNNLHLNVSKTKELIVDYRKQQREGHAPIAINGTTVERVSSFRFLGVHITEEPDMDSSHHHQNGSTAALFPPQAEEVQHGPFLTSLIFHFLAPEHPDLLQVHHREHPDLLQVVS
ncbi:thymidine kinase, cytosolic isoform X2 [Gymnodraco acuticeps]|uniref:Thymidine kinase, cytosolic isoform X2 n=1 Tax=Gymnodraco acuticeps TaxID=8218 RepID=A0A6P8WD92_GYMAC|nr:thymidine kinase, cytosolic isoform X2 [Gymnodraco acuticeps]